VINLGRHQVFQLLLVFLMLLQVSAGLASKQTDDSEKDRSWLEETLNRFFANQDPDENDMEGAGLELVSPYVQFAGKTIEVVIVRQVKSFEDGWDQDSLDAERFVHDFSRRFQDYTQEKIIRQYLLFKAGDTLVPFDLADTERLLRDLSYINDVRIHVVALDGEDDRVGVVVETNDRWPLGISATVITKDKWRAKIYSNNVAGLGISFSNEIIRNKESARDWGYRGILAKNNISGTFWDAAVDFEDSYRKQRLWLGLNRSLSHPKVNYIGGAQWQDIKEFENDEANRAFYQTDIWGGKVIKLYDRETVAGGDRPVFVPSVRILDKLHYERPVVYPDSNRSYQNYTQYMAALNWQKLKSYKTNYLYGEGEVEDIPTGASLKMTVALEDREFETRPGLFFDSAILSMRNRGDVAYLGFALGGFFDEKRVSDGVLDIKSAYYSPLLGAGKLRHRLYGGLFYTLGFGRHSGDRIYLDDKSGIYDLDKGEVAGNQRLVFKGMHRIFTPLALFGFRMSFYSFADVGAIGDDDSSIFKQKFYLSAGLGLRLRNPSLVLPTVELRMAMVTNVNDPGFSFGLNIGNAPGPEIIFPGNKPGTLAYQ